MPEFWKVTTATMADGGTPHAAQVTWMEYHDGRLRNLNGGGTGSRREVVLETATANDWQDLDWHGTSFDDQHAPDGWLAPDGYYWGCESMNHDTVALIVFKCHDARDAVAKGYIRIHAYSTINHKPFCIIGQGVTPTPAQLAYLKGRGIKHRFDTDTYETEEMEG